MRWLFVLANALFYGCAVHAAGFFMPRGMKLFGWLIIACRRRCCCRRPGSVAGTRCARSTTRSWARSSAWLHLAYGVYLYVTEPRERRA